jgi:hypothetical protein
MIRILRNSIFILMASVFVFGCAADIIKEEPKKRFELRTGSSAGTRVEYYSYGYLLRDINEQASAGHWSAETIFNRRADLPLGGKIFLYLEKPEYEAANPKWYKVHVMKDGVTVDTLVGMDKAPISTAGIWHNSVEMDIEQFIETPLDIRVEDNYSNLTVFYTIASPKN